MSDSTPSSFGRALRAAFLLDPAVTYLDHGAFGATPRGVLAAQRDWQHLLERGPAVFQEVRRFDALSRALERVGAFVGALPGDLAFVANATTGVNAVLSSLDLQPGDRLCTLDLGYPAVHRALRVWADRTGAAVDVARVPWPPTGEAVVEAVREALTARTRLLVVDHVTSATALVLPVGDLAELAGALDVPILVDGAHAPGQIALDVAELGVDWYTGNLHKWAFAPKSCAFLYARRDRQAGLEPPVISFAADDWRDRFHWQGTNDPATWLASTAGLDFLDALGPAAVRDHAHGLADRGASEVARAWDTARPFDAGLHAAMACVMLPPGLGSTEPAARAVHRRLRAEHDIEVPAFAGEGRLWVRLSAQVYNELGDYERLADAVAGW